MNNDVQEPETVAGHMYRMAMLSFLFTGGAGDGGRGITHSGSGVESEASRDARPSSDASGGAVRGTSAAATPVDRDRYMCHA